MDTRYARIQGRFTLEEMRVAIAAVLECATSDMATLEELSEQNLPDIYFHHNLSDSGDFPTFVDLELWKPRWDWCDDLEFGQRLAKRLNARLLTEACQIIHEDPYQDYCALVEPDGSTFLVVEDQDDDGNYCILEDTIRPAERIKFGRAK